MTSRSNLTRKLKSFGLAIETESGAYDRFSWPFGQGSLYVKENYISATGRAKSLEDKVRRTSSDSKGCPEWRGSAVAALLDELSSLTTTIGSQSTQPEVSKTREIDHGHFIASGNTEISANHERNVDVLLEEYMHNFYGYGCLSSPLWFIGMEEGVGDESLEDRLHAWEALGKSSTVDIREFHRLINEPRWFGLFPQIQKTWKGLILAALGYFDLPGGREEVRKYQKEKMATDDMALLEIMPLPHKNLSTWNHGDICSSKSEYRDKIAPERVAWLKNQISEMNPKAVVMYGTTPPYPDYWRMIAGASFNKSNEWEYCENDKTIYVVCKHPVAHGVTDLYFESIGNFLRNYRS